MVGDTLSWDPQKPGVLQVKGFIRFGRLAFSVNEREKERDCVCVCERERVSEQTGSVIGRQQSEG